MSGFAGALAGTVVSGPLNQVLENALLTFRFQRGFQFSSGPLLIPDCAIEETGRDDLQITEHPIESSGTMFSSITDHAYKKPQEVTLRWAWSNSDPRHFGQDATGAFTFNQLFSESYVQQIYATLINIQKQRTTFTLYTGKYKYDQMVIASLGQTTNASSEYSLMTVIVCRQVIFATLSSASITSLNTNSTDAPTNGPLTQAGTVQPQPQSASTTAQTGSQPQTYGVGTVQNTQVNPDTAGVGGGGGGSSAIDVGSGTGVANPVASSGSTPLYGITDANGNVTGLSSAGPVYPGQQPFTGQFGIPPPPGQ